jgi:hypothetical protein
MRIYIQGQPVDINQKDFKAAGGFGSVYIKGSEAYKIYSDPGNMIPYGKIQELSALKEDYIIKPEKIIEDEHKNIVGYTMKAIPNPISLSEYFPPAFRKQNNISPQDTADLVEIFRKRIDYVHQKDILIIDLNEFNFMLNQKKLKDIYFIDTDSYKTKSFPAVALMESVQDFTVKDNKFTDLSDWYSFAIISFYLFTGIHPYRGKHPGYSNLGLHDQLVQRMKDHVSVLNSQTKYPSIVLPFSIIPKTYLGWYKEVLEKGNRLPPPTDITEIILLTPKVTSISGTDNFDIDEIFDVQEEVKDYYNGYIITDKSVYRDKKRVCSANGKLKVLVTDKVNTIAYGEHNGFMEFYDLMKMEKINTDVNIPVEEYMHYDNRIYLKNGNKLEEIVFIEGTYKSNVALKHKADVLPHATRMFEGCVYQDIVGNPYFTFFPKRDTSYQVKIKELIGVKVNSAKFLKSILIVIGFDKNQYNKYIVRFSEDYQSYDLRIVPGIQTQDINFIVLDNNVVININDDELEMFLSKKDSNSITTVDDPAMKNIKLYSYGQKALFSKGDKLFKFSRKKTN